MRTSHSRTVRPFPLVALLAATLFACGSAEGDDRTPPTDEAVASGQAVADEAVAGRAAPPRGTAWVIFGADTVVAEVARTADERARGLMYRDEVPDGTGMLFVWDRASIRSFWMKDTYVPLDIAFMDESFRIVDIQQMEAEVEEYHYSAAPALFALEVREGWFAEHGVEVGAVAEIVFGG